MKDHSIPVDYARYTSSIVEKYLDTVTVKTNTKFYNNILPSAIIFIKADASTSDNVLEKLSREFKIHYRACIGSLIYLLSTRVDLRFVVHKLEEFQQSLVNYTLKGWYIY